jgi:DUF4097 and DUF4098 domain-containing protein YvlB
MTSMKSRRAVALVLSAAGAATVLSGCGGVGARLTFNDTEVKVSEIVMSGRSGDVAVRTAPITETRINRVIHRNSDPGRTYRVEGTVLYVDTDCGRNCSVAYDIEAPAGVTVRGEVTSGDLALDGVGATDVKLTSGDVMIRNATGAVRVQGTSGDITVLDSVGTTIRTTSGDVRAMNIAGPVSAAVTSGDVTIKLITAASVAARTTSGDVDVIVPPGSYAVTADSTGSGDQQVVGVVDDPKAKNTIEVSTSSGDATVSAAPPA